MSYLKMCGAALAALVAAGMLVAAVPASATVLCKVPSSSSCGVGNQYSLGTVIEGGLEGVEGEHPFTVDNGAEKQYFECTRSPFKQRLASAGGAETVSGNTETHDFSNCTTSSLLVLKWGSFEYHWISGTNNATVTLKGVEYTYERSGLHCVLATQAGGSDAGTLTASSSSTSPATWDFTMAVTRIGGRTSALCPSSLTLTGRYTVATPVPLYVTGS